MNETKPVWIKFLPDLIRAKIEDRHYLQNVISNTGWLLFDNILRMGVGLFVGVWVARYLGPDQYGQLSYALAFVLLFSSLANLGLDSIAVRNLVRDASNKDDILGTVFVLKFAGGAAAFATTMAVIFFLRPADSLTQWLVGIISVGMIIQAFDTIDYWFKSQVKSKYSVISKNSAFLLISIVKIILIVIKAPLIAFAWTGLAEIVIGSLGLIVAYRINEHHLRAWHASLVVAKELLRDSWPLIFSGIVTTIYMRIDQVMLGEMVNAKEVGIYSAAVRLAEVWYFIPAIIYSSVYPSIVEARSMREALFYDRLQKLYNIMAFGGILIALPMTFAADWIADLLFGVSYTRAGPMLAILVWAGLFVNLGIARSSFLMSMNWTKTHFVTVFMGCLVNVVLNLILIPRYGGMGAAIASCIAYWFATHGACFFYKPLHTTGYMITKALLYPKVW